MAVSEQFHRRESIAFLAFRLMTCCTFLSFCNLHIFLLELELIQIKRVATQRLFTKTNRSLPFRLKLRVVVMRVFERSYRILADCDEHVMKQILFEMSL